MNGYQQFLRKRVDLHVNTKNGQPAFSDVHAQNCIQQFQIRPTDDSGIIHKQ